MGFPLKTFIRRLSKIYSFCMYAGYCFCVHIRISKPVRLFVPDPSTEPTGADNASIEFAHKQIARALAFTANACL